jgi:hypothetical protein
MNTTHAALLLCLSLTITYFAARSGRIGLPYVTIIGLVMNSFAFVQYMMIQQPQFARAAVTGLQLSLIFTVLSVGIAFVFRILATMEPTQQRALVTSDLVELFFS